MLLCTPIGTVELGGNDPVRPCPAMRLHAVAALNYKISSYRKNRGPRRCFAAHFLRESRPYRSFITIIIITFQKYY